jgi:hypothetical protein
MKNKKKFRFDPEHAALIAKSAGEFKNNTVKYVTAYGVIGAGAPQGSDPGSHFKFWDRVIVDFAS